MILWLKPEFPHPWILYHRIHNCNRKKYISVLLLKIITTIPWSYHPCTDTFERLFRITLCVCRLQAVVLQSWWSLRNCNRSISQQEFLGQISWVPLHNKPIFCSLAFAAYLGSLIAAVNSAPLWGDNKCPFFLAIVENEGSCIFIGARFQSWVDYLNTWQLS